MSSIRICVKLPDTTIELSAVSSHFDTMFVLSFQIFKKQKKLYKRTAIDNYNIYSIK